MGSPPSLPERERSCDVIYWGLYSPEAVLFFVWTQTCLLVSSLSWGANSCAVLHASANILSVLFLLCSCSPVTLLDSSYGGNYLRGGYYSSLFKSFFFILNLSTFQLGVTHTNVICIPFFATWKALIEMLGRQDQEHSLFLGTECNIPNCNWYNHKNTMASQQGMGQPNYKTVFVFTP